MKQIIITLLLAAICFTAQGEGVMEYVQAGDSFYEKGDPYGALEQYTLASEYDENSYDVLWRLSRCYRKMGALAKKKKDLIMNTMKAREYAVKAVEVDPGRFEGHLSLADASSRIVAHAPFSKVYKYILDIKLSAEKAIKLNPSSDRAYLILGVWHRKISEATWIQKTLIKAFWGSVPEASLDESVSLLRNAVELDGTRIRHHYELAMSYKAQGDPVSAAASFEKVLKCTPQNKWDEEVLGESKKYLRV